jgi:hypothetical protein
VGRGAFDWERARRDAGTHERELDSPTSGRITALSVTAFRLSDLSVCASDVSCGPTEPRTPPSVDGNGLSESTFGPTDYRSGLSGTAVPVTDRTGCVSESSAGMAEKCCGVTE